MKDTVTTVTPLKAELNRGESGDPRTLELKEVPKCPRFQTYYSLNLLCSLESTLLSTPMDHILSVELFQILKDDAVKVLHSICHQIRKTQQWPQDWKRSVFIPIPKKGNAKECSNYYTIALISHASKVMLKILQASELPDVQAGFRKGRGTRDQIASIRWIMEKAREF